MSDNQPVIDALNGVLTGELTSINQYFVHAEMCTHWGFKKLGKIVREQSIEEMRHAEDLIERILMLGGIPNVQKLDKISLGEDVAEQFKLDLILEKEALPRLNKAIALCHETPDHVSRVLLESILKSEEDHIEWIEEQLNVIDTVGLQNYLALQVGDSSE